MKKIFLLQETTMLKFITQTYFFTIVLSTLLFAQSSLYMPLDIRKAYANGTRSYDGKPGENYWTNHADYTIRAELTPQSRAVDGQVSILYYNESPDSLKEIVIRLYQDFYSKTNPRDWPIHPDDINDGVTLKSIAINGRALDMKAEKPEFRRSRTNLMLNLKEALAPKKQIKIAISWSYTLPHKTNLRMGTYDSTSFFVGHWYPQVAVYDDVNGWDLYNYSGIQEFYNDCNNFDVKVKVPQNFIVWATGILQNPKQVLNQKYLERYLKARESDRIINVVAQGDEDITRPDTPDWHFVARAVPDFAFATSDHYLWDMTSLIVGPHRRVAIGAAYKKESKDFYEVAQIARESIAYFSQELPGVPFPYPELTVFNGGGGMEYPMMVNDGSIPERAGTVHVTSHEILHSYFPFFMGTNERKYAWMDEGWAQMLPFEIQHRLAPEYDPPDYTTKRYLQVAGTEFDIPEIVPSIIYGSNAPRLSYRNSAYNRSAVAYNLLKNLLGKKLFARALQEYIKRWHHKHPIPYDFFFTISDVAKEDLSWFFKPWFFDFGYPDLAIQRVKQSGRQLSVTVERKGALPVPLRLTIEFADSSKQILEKNLHLWKDGSKFYTFKIALDKEIAGIILGDNHIPDVNKEDNTYNFQK